MLTEDELLASSPGDYMNAGQQAFFRARLQQLRVETMARIEEAKQRLASPPETNDDADRAQYEEESRLLLRIVDRERRLLPKIDAALRRIQLGEYGYCEQTGEPIGLPRLLLRPTAELCADVKNLSEARERFYSDRR